MADNRTASVTLRADTTQYQRALRQASAATTEMDKAQAKAQRNAQRWEAIGVASKVAGAAVAAGLMYATKAASDQEQAVGALTATFRENSAAMQQNAREATNIGLSITDYSNAAAKLGGQLSNLGVDQKDLAVTTDDLINKAADLAAQYGGTTMEAVDALGAAFRGEADPAERYSLALNATQVAAEQAATGYDKAGAMLSLINKQMEKTGSAGAAMREFDTAAASVARAQAEFDNATASLGEALLPALTKAAQAAADVVGVFNGLPQPLKDATTYMIAFGGAALLAGPKIAAAGKAVTDLAIALGAAGKAGPALAAVFGTAGVTGTLIAATGATQGQKWATDQLAQSITDATGANEHFAQGLADLGRYVGPTGMLLGGLQGALESLTASSQDSITGFVRNLLGMDDELQGFTDRINAGEGDMKTFVQAINDGKSPADAFAEAQHAAAAATQDSADASYKDAEAKENQAAATKKAVEAYEAYLDAVRRALGLLDARDALIGQEERLAEAVKKNGAALRGRTKAAAANREALSTEAENIANLVQQTYENVAAKKDEAAGLRAANRVRREQIRTLLENAEAAGLDRDQVRGLLRQLNLLKPINTSITVSGLSEAERRARSLVNSLIEASGLGAFGFGGGGRRPRRRAKGGYISGPGGPTADKIPAMLSNGEYVVRASAVDRLGVGFFDALNYADGGVVGYARGGRARRRGGRGGGRGGGGGGAGLGAALRETQRWSDAVTEARENLNDLLEQRADFAASFSSGVIGNAGPSIFQQFSQAAVDQARGNLEDAQRARAEAADELQAARVALNNSSPEERAAALDRLTKAQAAYNSALGGEAAAQQAANNAAPTGANILAAAKERADRVIKYARDVKALMARGMSMAMIKDLAGEDILQAGPIIEALLKMPADQFAELQATDARMRAAADSLGTAVAKKEFAPQVMDARINLTASQDSLDKAIKKADKTVDKQWRNKLAKIGLSAEERVQFMAAIRDNDGKLTRFWRNKLAAAGLSAEERKELLEGIGLADKTLGANWRDKINDTGLSAKERADLIEKAIGSADELLGKSWTNVLKEAGLSAADRQDLIENAIKRGDGTVSAKWTAVLKEAGLSASERKDLIENAIKNANTTLAGYSTADRNAILSALKSAGFDGTVNDAKDAADRVAGDRIANLKADKIDEPVKKADEVSGAADKVRGDRTANLRADRIDEPIKKADEVTGAADRVRGDRTANLKADRIDEPIKKADEVFNAVSRIDRTFAARLTVQVAQAEVNKATEWVEAFARWQRAARRNPDKAGPAPTPGNLGRWGKARGGLIVGAGTATSDSIPAMLSNGEYVIRASSVSRYGVDLMNAINTGRFASGGPVGFRTTTTAPVAMSGGVTLATSGVPIVVRMDNRTVATGQLKLQRQSGGTVTLGG